MKQRTPFKVLFKCFLREYIEHTPMPRPLHALFTQAYLNSGAFLHGVKQKNMQTEQYMKMLIRYFEENYPPVAKVIHAHEQMLRKVFDGDYLKMNRWAKPGYVHICYSFEAKVNNGRTTVVPVYADSPDKIEVEYRDVNLKSKPRWMDPDGKLVSKSAKHAPASLTPATEQMPELVAQIVESAEPQPEPTETLPEPTELVSEPKKRGAKRKTTTIEKVCPEHAAEFRERVKGIVNKESPQEYLDIAKDLGISAKAMKFCVANDLGYPGGDSNVRKWNSARSKREGLEEIDRKKKEKQATARE